MEQSPLTQQARPDVFEPKVVGLYRQLFKGTDDVDELEGFWSTLFLLKPDPTALREILEELDADTLLHSQHQSQQLLLQALAQIKAARAPSDENALDTLTVFLSAVLAKKFASPSSDIIEVLAGLDSVDSVFSELVFTIDHAIRDGHTSSLRQKAVRTAIAVVAGGYHTALVSYFVHRDFFPGLMKLIHQLDNPFQASEPLLLIGLLANYNKFETHNPYRIRFADFVNENAMARVVHSVAWTSTVLRERYIAIQDDTPAAWSISGTLSYVGLGTLAGAQPATTVLTEDQQRELFSAQPGEEASIILTLYDFALANKFFCHKFVTLPAIEKGQAPPFSLFISFASYLYQQAYRTARASAYAYLTLLVLLILVEETTTAKLLCETKAPVRLCQQRPPHLPIPKGDRAYTGSLIDLLIDGVNHNLRKRLDTKLYSLTLAVLSRILTYLTKTRMKLAYHWSELWRSLLSFVRFLTTYADELRVHYGTNQLVESLVSLLSGALSNGEAFLPDAAAYDDLIYKLVENGDALVKFRDVYQLSNAQARSPINTLINVSKHYQELIDTNKSGSTHLSPKEVSKIIKQGYETLSIETKEGTEVVEKFRESDYKVEVKKIARVVVADASALIS